MGKSAAKSVVCPRCEYDLQGQVDTWRVPLSSQADVVRFERGEVLESEVGAKCPVEGTCSECGLLFEWKFVFRPELAGPAWFVETRRVSALRAFVGTALRVLWLFPFFRSRGGVRIETPRRWDRVVWYLAMWVVVLPPISFVLRQMWGVVVLWQQLGKSFGGATYLVFASTPKDLLHVILTMRFAGGSNWFFVGVFSSLGFATMMMVLPYTRAKAKVHTSHVVRAAAYAITWLAFPALIETFAAVVEGVASLLPVATRRSAMSFDLQEFLRELGRAMWSRDFRGLLICATAIWCCVYWWQVMRKWWRMEEAVVAYVACAVPVALMVVTAIAYNYPQF